MSCHVLTKVALLAAILILLVLKGGSAEGQLPRLLGGVSDQTSVEVEQASTQGLDQGEPSYHKETSSADGPLRQLDGRRPLPAHLPLPASTRARARSQHFPPKRHQMMKATHPSKGTSTSSRGRSKHHTRHRMRKGTHPQQGTSTSVRGQPRHAPHAQHQMMNGTHPTQGASTSVRGRSSHSPQVKKQMMKGSHRSNGTVTSFRGNVPKVKNQMMQGMRHSSPRHRTPGSHKQMKGRHAGTRALASADDQLRHLASKKKPRRIHGQHGPHVRASQNHVRSAMPHHERLRQGVARPV